MSGSGQNIRSLYFGYEPVREHAPGCPREGSDLWEATRFTNESYGGQVRETVFRFVCAECGAAAFFRTDGAPGEERTHASTIGFGSKPERVAGLWLHPGPLLLHGDGRGPAAFYVTRTKDRPREPGDVTGVVAWQLGPRGGVRWRAGLGVTEHGSAGTVAGSDFSSRRAAVAWIAGQLGGLPAGSGGGSR